MAEKNILSSEHDQLLKEIVIDHDFDLFKLCIRFHLHCVKKAFSPECVFCAKNARGNSSNIVANRADMIIPIQGDNTNTAS